MSSLTKKFETFARKNPDFYDLLVKYAREAKRAGKRRYGISPCIERARWALDVETNRLDEEEFKINAVYAAFYARLIMYRESDLRDFFATRASEADAWIYKVRTGQITKWW